MFRKDEVSMWEWILANLILAIPLVGFVMIFVFAFGDYNATFSNYYKSALLTSVVLVGLLFLIVIGTLVIGGVDMAVISGY